MFCSNCGTHLPDDANFCFKCGRPQSTEFQSRKSNTEQWETCDLVWELVAKGKQGWFSSEPSTMRFWAKAIGAKGSYVAATSETFTSGWTEPIQQLGNYSLSDKQLLQLKKEKGHFESLLAELIRNGWMVVEHPLENTFNWWTYKLRRKVQFE